MTPSMQTAGMVVIALAILKVLELVVLKKLNGKMQNGCKANGLSVELHRLCGEIAKDQALIATRLKDISNMQVKITEAMQKHEAQVAIWLARGCPNDDSVRGCLQQIKAVADQMGT